MNKKYCVVLILVLFFIALAPLDSVAMPIQKVVLKSTVFLKNPYGNVGTGFLISTQSYDGGQAVFLITNKHILRKDRVGPYSPFIDVRFYKREAEGEKDGSVAWVRIPLLNNKKELNDLVFLHPEDKVDIVGVFINSFVEKHSKEIEFVNLGSDLILTREKAMKEAIDVGEDVHILGYPVGIFSQSNYLPLVKSGVLSTSTADDLTLTLDSEFRGKIYLVEASLFSGNSGGPVIVKHRWKIKRDPETLQQKMLIGQGIPPYLVGICGGSIQMKDKMIVQEPNKGNRYIEIEKDIMLNIVYSAEYILDIFTSYQKRFEDKISNNRSGLQ